MILPFAQQKKNARVGQHDIFRQVAVFFHLRAARYGFQMRAGGFAFDIADNAVAAGGDAKIGRAGAAFALRLV